MNARSKDGSTCISSTVNISDNTEDILRRILHGDVQGSPPQQSLSPAARTRRSTTSGGVLDMIISVKNRDELKSSRPRRQTMSNSNTSHMMAQELRQGLGHIRAKHEGNSALIECESLSLLLEAALKVSEECSLGTVGTIVRSQLSTTSTTSTSSTKRRRKKNHHRISNKRSKEEEQKWQVRPLH